MRTPLIIANWKMNGIPKGALEENSPYRTHSAVDVVVFPTNIDIRPCAESKIITGAQLGSVEECGAHTGDVCMKLLEKAGCRYVLCGHSERRKEPHNETDNDVTAQVIAALEAGLHPIICIGETEKQRDAGKEKEVVKKQMSSLPLESDLTIAYEPVWAIGTGKTATPEQAQEMHKYIRSLLPEDRQEQTRILYGGSMKPENAEELLKQPDIDGGLIGGASLDPKKFGEIVTTAIQIAGS